MNPRPRWDRPTLKQYAKTALKNFYWKAVLASLIFAILGLSFETGSGNGNGVKWIVDGTNLDFSYPFRNYDGALFTVVGVVIFFLIFMFIFVLGLLYSILVSGPLEVGHNRFYLESRSAPTVSADCFMPLTAATTAMW